MQNKHIECRSLSLLQTILNFNCVPGRKHFEFSYLAIKERTMKKSKLTDIPKLLRLSNCNDFECAYLEFGKGVNEIVSTTISMPSNLLQI